MPWIKTETGQWEKAVRKNGEWVGSGYRRNPVVNGKELPVSSRSPRTAVKAEPQIAQTAANTRSAPDAYEESPPPARTAPDAPRLSESAEPKPVYEDAYGDRMEDVYRRYSERAPFSYDAADDPLFRSYRDAYTQSGKLAMRDTLGQAASLTGGYASSYGQAAGQQAFDSYLQKLGEVIPTLYGLAYDRYRDEGDRLLNQHSMLGSRRDAAYSRYRDALGDWQSDRAWQGEQEKQAAETEERAYRRAADADNAAWQRRKDSYASLYTAIKTGGYRPTDEELTAAGMTRAAADALLAEYRRGADLDEREIAVKESKAGGSGIANELWDYDPERGWFVTARR